MKSRFQAVSEMSSYSAAVFRQSFIGKRLTAHSLFQAADLQISLALPQTALAIFAIYDEFLKSRFARRCFATEL